MTVSDPPGFPARLEAAAAGDRDALGELFRWYQPSLVRFLTAMAGDEAEDLATETWMGVAKALEGFSGGETEFRRLLFTIARRRLVDHVRRRHRRRTDPADDLRFDDLPGAPDVADAVAEADAAVRAVQTVAALLPPEQAEVILLRVVAGLSVDEVGAIVGRRPGAVSVLQSRGLRRLATKMGDAARFEREPRHQ